MEQCTNCHAGCCRALNVELIGCDILNLYKTLGINPFAFIMAMPVDKGKLEEKVGEKPLFKFTDLTENTYYKLILQSDISELMMFTNKCIFLMEWDVTKLGSKKMIGTNNIIGRCGIYHCRPFTCRTFPAILEGEEPYMLNPYTKIKQKQDEEDDFWKKPAYQLCPKPVELKDYIHFSNQYFKDLQEQDYETKYFLKIAEKWNQNPDISDNFIKFLEQEYENRISPPQT